MPNPNNSDPNYLRTDQYKDDKNLSARIHLHKHFSINPQPWPLWVFEQLSAPAEAHILEIGCGPGSLWYEYTPPIPPGWSLTLTDLSLGMAAKACQNIAHPAAQYACASGPTLPFPANHMLYHVPDLPQTLAELRRVLKPGGRFYAATNGVGHLAEMRTIILEYDPEVQFQEVNWPFNLENGAAQLTEYFDNVEKHIYPDSIQLTHAQPQGGFIQSLQGIYGIQRMDEAALLALIESKLDQDGVIQIQKSTGIFVAKKV